MAADQVEGGVVEADAIVCPRLVLIDHQVPTPEQGTLQWLVPTGGDAPFLVSAMAA